MNISVSEMVYTIKWMSLFWLDNSVVSLAISALPFFWDFLLLQLKHPIVSVCHHRFESHCCRYWLGFQKTVIMMWEIIIEKADSPLCLPSELYVLHILRNPNVLNSLIILRLFFFLCSWSNPPYLIFVVVLLIFSYLCKGMPLGLSDQNWNTFWAYANVHSRLNPHSVKASPLMRPNPCVNTVIWQASHFLRALSFYMQSTS